MPAVSKTTQFPKSDRVTASEISDGIYRISGFVESYGITFNQFLIVDEQPMLIHTGPIGMYKQIEERVKEIVPLEKLSYVAFLHFEADEWGGMEFLQSKDVQLVCSDLSSKLNLAGWYDIPVNHVSFWDNETMKTGKRKFRFMMTPHVHHWDSMMVYEESTKSLFTSDLFIQPRINTPVISQDLSQQMIELYRAVGIFASEGPVRQTTKRLLDLHPSMVYPMHGSCIDNGLFQNYASAIMNQSFAYSGRLLGQKLETVT